MMSLCSGCLFYYSFQCPLTIDQQSHVLSCERFHFTATASFKDPDKFEQAVKDYFKEAGQT